MTVDDYSRVAALRKILDQLEPVPDLMGEGGLLCEPIERAIVSAIAYATEELQRGEERLAERWEATYGAATR